MPKNNYSVGIIPARYASSRFPGKPLVEIQGKSMVQRVYEQACNSNLDMVVVATDDERIFNHLQSTNGRVVMTSSFHKTGTDRCAEVAGLQEFEGAEIVLNIQGDEPFIEPEQINQLLGFLKKNEMFEIGTLAKKIVSTDQLFDPNVVKVVFDKRCKALYFSRSAIPFANKNNAQEWLKKSDYFKHIGIYGFRKEVLLELSKLQISKLERAESLEQLRWLESGFSIGVEVTNYNSISIDVPDDLKKIPNL